MASYSIEMKYVNRLTIHCYLLLNKYDKRAVKLIESNETLQKMPIKNFKHKKGIEVRCFSIIVEMLNPSKKIKY